MENAEIVLTPYDKKITTLPHNNGEIYDMEQIACRKSGIVSQLNTDFS